MLLGLGYFYKFVMFYFLFFFFKKQKVIDLKKASFPKFCDIIFQVFVRASRARRPTN